jgi:hypothetical protein
MSKLKPQTKVSGQGSPGLITVLNPACSSTMAEQVPLAPRTIKSLEGKTIYLVDIGWGGPKAGYDLFEVMQGWLAERIPTARTVLVKKKGGFGDDDPDLWKKIKANGDACIIGLSC